MGQQNHRKTVHHPCVIHQLLKNLRQCVTTLRARVNHTTVLDLHHNVVTIAAACHSVVSLTPIMSSSFHKELQSTMFQLSQHRFNTNCLSFFVFPNARLFRIHTVAQYQSQKRYCSTVASRMCNPNHRLELPASIVHQLWIFRLRVLHKIDSIAIL